MTNLTVLPEASEELAASAGYYESQQRGLGVALVTEVEKSFNRILQHPKAAQVVAGVIRRRLVHRFPFSVLYRVRENDVVIVAIAHRHRRPGYWLDRT